MPGPAMTPGELAAFEVLDGARRAGWARVAALEEIIDVYRSTVLASAT